MKNYYWQNTNELHSEAIFQCPPQNNGSEPSRPRWYFFPIFQIHTIFFELPKEVVIIDAEIVV